MIETVLLAFIVARLKGYKLLHILKHWTIYPVLICAATYIFLEWTIWQGDYSYIKYSNVFKMVYLSSIIILAFKYNQIKALTFSLPLVWLGYGLNYIAVKANDGKMPVFPDLSYATGYAKPDIFTNASMYGDYHVLGDAYTNLIPLCDIFDVGYGVWSIGDILIRSFVFIILYYSIKESNRHYE